MYIDFLNLTLLLVTPATSLLLALFMKKFGYAAGVAFLTTLAVLSSASLVKELFAVTPRVMAASIVVYYLSNLLDVFVFEKVKERTRGQYLFARNILGEVVADDHAYC